MACDVLYSSLRNTGTHACVRASEREGRIMPLTIKENVRPRVKPGTMRANVFREPGRFGLSERPIPRAGPGEAIVRGEYPVRPGLTIGHEAVGLIHEIGTGVTGYEAGQRVLIGAITPCGQCRACLSGHSSQCGHGGDYEALGGWRFGNTINGSQAEYLLVPNAQANLAPIPDEVTDEQVVLLADIASTGISGAESGKVTLG